MAIHWTRHVAANYPIIVTLRTGLLENATSVPPVPRKLWFI